MDAAVDPAVGAAVSVVIRVRDQEVRLARLLRALAQQTIGPDRQQLIVVDGGSRDQSIAIARRAGAQVVELSPAQWSYGRATNRGVQAATAETVVVVSAHALPPDPGWLERLAGWLQDGLVCAVCGDSHGPGNVALKEPWRQDIAAARRDPFWGFSTTGGALRRSLWSERPFREDLPGTEDREWAWHWMQKGHVVAIDPALVVHTDRGREGLRAHYRRGLIQFAGYAAFLDLPAYGPRDLVKEWWTDRGYHRSHLRARLILGEPRPCWGPTAAVSPAVAREPRWRSRRRASSAASEGGGCP